MTIDPSDHQGSGEDEARRKLEAWIQAWIDDPELESKLADLHDRAMSSPPLSNKDLAEALGLPESVRLQVERELREGR